MFPEPHFVNTNGIRMAVYEQGEGPPVILLHGFPELAFSWRHQLAALAAAGYRAIAPDQRGYGRTSVPPEQRVQNIPTIELSKAKEERSKKQPTGSWYSRKRATVE